MQLQTFPFDVQRLSLVLAINCATQGIVPVKFLVTRDAAITVARGTFALSNLWELHDSAMVEPETIEPMPQTSYPALRVSALVARKPPYYIVNVIIPMASLTFLALLQFLLDGQREATNTTFRITYSVTILLTTATYKLFIASALPVGLAYLTLLDKYVLLCFLLQVAIVSETAVVGSLVMKSMTSDSNAWLPEWSTSAGDFFAGCVALSIFILGHLWFLYKFLGSATAAEEHKRIFALADHNHALLFEGGDLSARGAAANSMRHFSNYRLRASFGSSVEGRCRSNKLPLHRGNSQTNMGGGVDPFAADNAMPSREPTDQTRRISFTQKMPKMSGSDSFKVNARNGGMSSDGFEMAKREREADAAEKQLFRSDGFEAGRVLIRSDGFEAGKQVV